MRRPEGSGRRGARAAVELLRLFGIAESSLVIRDFLAKKILYHSRWIARPGLSDLWSDSSAVLNDPKEFVEALVGAVDKREWKALLEEFAESTFSLSQRNLSKPLAYGNEWAVEPDSALALYATVRRLRPEIVIETGVADGYSTYHLLAALNRNRRGHLHSVDISSDVGGLLTGDEKQRWTLHVISPRDVRTGFAHVVASVGEIGYFLHDSDHTFRHQKRELNTVLKHMARGGLIACDDADSSFAFIDFCSSIRTSARFLAGRHKVLGATRLSH